MSATTAGLLQVLLVVVSPRGRPPPARRLHGAGVHERATPARRAARLPLHRGRPRRRPALVGLPAQRARLLVRVDRRALRLPASAGVPSPVLGVPGGRARPGLEHRCLVRDQHELAVVLGRVHDGLPRPDGRPGGAELRLGRRRHRGRDRADPRARALAHRPARQLLGGPGPWSHPDPAAAGVRRSPWCSSPAGVVQNFVQPGDVTTGRGGHAERHRRTGRLPGGHQGARAPTAAASTTPTPRTRSRTRTPGPTCSRSSCSCSSRSACPAPSAGWSATPAGLRDRRRDGDPVPRLRSP